ncbi:MAG: RimK domain-containing protein ATP-grasp [Pseudomonadota bacterium]
MIVLWGISDDGPMLAVRQELARRGAPVIFVDQFSVDTVAVDLEADSPLSGVLEVGGRGYGLGDVGAFYLRPYDSARVAAARSADAAMKIEAARVDDALLLFAELTPTIVVNRPSAMASNGSKPLQAALIAREGFDVPETLLTTDAEAAEEFRDRHGGAIYKSASGVRSRVALLDDAALGRLAGAACPLQLQSRIPGVDHRVHVVGDDIFPAVVTSSAVDYRYPGADGEAPEIASCEIPVDIAGRCVALTRALGLCLSGVDLRRTPEGRWFCFEVNPSPAYTFYEEATGAPITAALAALLAAQGVCKTWPG